MKYLVLVFAVVITTAVRAVIIEPLTPKSYVLSFVAERVLPPNAKVVGVSLEVDQAEAVRVRSMPPGWLATVVHPTRAKFGVGIDLFNWGKDQGSPVPLAEMNDRFWIVAVVGADDKPLLPSVQVWVSYILPPKGEVLSMQVPSSSIRLTYIP